MKMKEMRQPGTETMAELEKILADFEQKRGKAGARTTELSTKIAALTKEQSEAKTALHTFNRQVAKTQERIFVRSVPSQKIIIMRQALIAKIVKAQSDHITIARQATLRAEIKEALAKLQAACRHELVFSYDGYEGSQSCDWVDAHYGEHVCTLCNLRETSKSTREDKYSVLVDDETHFVLRDLRHKKDSFSFKQEWFSVEFLRQLFEASAGGINVFWPKERGLSDIGSNFDPLQFADVLLIV